MWEVPAITDVHMDLTISDSDEDIDLTAKKLENNLLSSKMTRETNTTISCTEMIDKAVNTDPLIILSPDEVLQFQDGLTIASFTENLKIFVETINSDIMFCKPNLERPKTPTSQIG